MIIVSRLLECVLLLEYVLLLLLELMLINSRRPHMSPLSRRPHMSPLNPPPAPGGDMVEKLLESLNGVHHSIIIIKKIKHSIIMERLTTVHQRIMTPTQLS